MKKRLLLLTSGVLLMSILLRSGSLPAILQGIGQRAALCAVARSPFISVDPPEENEECFEETLPLTDTKTETNETSTSAPVINLSINNGKYKVQSGVALKNGTRYKVDVPAMLRAGFEKPNFQKDAPSVLIYHTHATESYADAKTEYSTASDKGVLAVGEQMKKVFESKGLQTIHLTDNFVEGGAFNKAYTRSLVGVEQTLAKYPSIRIVLDIHRDSISESGTEYCPMTLINGKEYAQVMVISGSDSLGLSHPNWKQNLGFGLALVKKLQEDYPGLSRPLYFNANRYNTHTTPYALLVEVGGSANTVTQAIRSGEAVAESICKIVN